MNIELNYRIKDGGLHVVGSDNPSMENTLISSDGSSDKPLFINSCDYNYFDHNEKRVTVYRPGGREDW